MSAWTYLFLCSVIKTCCGMEYLLDADYNQMPSLFYADDYKNCVTETDWAYCIVDMTLISDETSQLSTMIQDYSKHYLRHYNQSILTHGVCVRKACANYMNGTSGITSLKNLESCLNETIWRKYKLKTKVLNQPICSSYGDKYYLSPIDMAVYFIFVLIIAFNVAGSYNDVSSKGAQYNQAPFLRCFSFSKNIRTLFETRSQVSGNQMICMKSLDGIRCISMLFLIFIHAPIGIASISSNPQYIEQFYDWSIPYLLLNGHVVVNVFFILSSFLLVYNKRFVASGIGNIKLILKNISTRYLRLTPPYAVTLAFNVACLKLFHNTESQPLWKKAVGEEISHCRKYYMSNLMYTNNYHLESQCLNHSWYIAADMQLYVLGLTVCVLAKRPVVRYLTLAAIFIAGLLLPALTTYYHNLHGILTSTPESMRTNFMRNNDFLYMYRPGHMNISCFIMGMALAYVVNHLQKTNFNIQNYKKYTRFYWTTLPIVLIFICLGKMFYVETSRQPMWIRVAAAALYKPIFALLISIIIFGQLFKLENIYSRVLGWSGWTPVSRISYCVYLTQSTIIRHFVANHTTLIYTSAYSLVMNFFCVLVISMLAALVLWLTVEAPVSNLLRLYSTRDTVHRNGTKIQ